MAEPSERVARSLASRHYRILQSVGMDSDKPSRNASAYIFNSLHELLTTHSTLEQDAEAWTFSRLGTQSSGLLHGPGCSDSSSSFIERLWSSSLTKYEVEPQRCLIVANPSCVLRSDQL